MLTFQDCLGFCELTEDEDEIDAIAEHEHLPEIVAAELGNCLIRAADGQLQIQRMIFDDMVAALRRGDRARAVRLEHTLRQFIEAPAVGRDRLPVAQGPCPVITSRPA